MSRLDLIHDWLAKAAEAHYNAPQLATLCGVRPRHLRRWFNQWTGDAVRPWLSEVQLWSSIPMLIDGRLIKEIGSDLGFSSPADFCIRFKRRFGVSPTRLLQDRRAVRQLVEASRSITRSASNGPGHAHRSPPVCHRNEDLNASGPRAARWLGERRGGPPCSIRVGAPVPSLENSLRSAGRRKCRCV
jgi:AraC-like DNA-binding protein